MDIEVDRRFSDLEQTTKENTLILNDIQTVLLGPLPARNSGISGAVESLKNEFKESMEWARNLWNVKRRDECLGVEESKKIWKKIGELEEKEENMTTAQINLRGVYIMGILQFIGMILVALISAGVFK